MATAGPNSPSTGTNVTPGPGNDVLGAWLNPGNITTADATSARCATNSGSSHIDLGARVVKGGSISGNNKAVGTSLPGSASYLSYGGASDLHGLSLTPADVNASDFGFAFATRSTGGSGTNWLVATGFGFSVPTGATIDGVLAEVRCSQDAGVYSYVDHVRITVYYTVGGSAVGAARHHYQQQGMC